MLVGVDSMSAPSLRLTVKLSSPGCRVSPVFAGGVAWCVSRSVSNLCRLGLRLSPWSAASQVIVHVSTRPGQETAIPLLKEQLGDAAQCPETVLQTRGARPDLRVRLPWP